MANDDFVINLHSFLPHSLANGPGARAVLWTQGCSLGCEGCFNPDTHLIGSGTPVPADDLFVRIAELDDAIEGVTISGGEPLQQRDAIAYLLRRIKAETPLSVLFFSGYAWHEVQCLAPEMLGDIDVLIAGRYIRTLHLAHGLRGSANKTVHFLTDRYTPDDLVAVSAAEVIISENGDVLVSGIAPVQL